MYNYKEKYYFMFFISIIMSIIFVAPTFARNVRERREPDLVQIQEDLPQHAKGKAKKEFSATVPVYFHIITDGTIGDFENHYVIAQINAIESAFAGKEGEFAADTGFSFQLKSIDRTNNSAWFYSAPGSKDEYAMKQALRKGGKDALNVYSNNAGSFYLGWAYLPSVLDSKKAILDGIVIYWETVPGVSDALAGRYDLGHTLTHEAGHWLNLLHTFAGGCSNFGDFCADTPAQRYPTRGCPADFTKDTCPKDPGFDPIHNFMDYSYDLCYQEFTPDQAQRMKDSWLLYRGSSF